MICSEKDCTGEVKTKTYCDVHYRKFIKDHKLGLEKGIGRHGKVCESIICKKGTLTNRKYCWKCQEKADKGLDPNKNHKGEGLRKYRETLGTSKYGNTTIFREKRKERLELVGCKCEHCGIEKPKHKLNCHHIDKDKKNHDLSNLKILCTKCHLGIYHKGEIGVQKKHKDRIRCTHCDGKGYTKKEAN